MNFKSPHLRWIILWECVERLAIDGQRSLQLSLIRIETAELQQRADSRVLVRRPVSQAGAVELSSVAKHRGGLMATAERDERRAEIQVGHCKERRKRFDEHFHKFEAVDLTAFRGAH